MTVFNLGSINLDLFYRVPHLPMPGETLPATSHYTGLGGKGANQSVAVAKAGSAVRHIGMIGADGDWVRDKLVGYGVDTRHVGTCTEPTGHAIINVDDAGENAIVTFAGANYAQKTETIEKALGEAAAGDIYMLQNEVSLKSEAAGLAKAKGLFVVYSAAPFDAGIAREMLPFVDLLVVNEIELAQLANALDVSEYDVPVPHLLITRGAKGAVWRDQETGDETVSSAFPVAPVDTTGAGDCFIGYTVAGLDQGLSRAEALRVAAAASAVKVTRRGTADAIPERGDVEAFLAGIDTQ